MRLRERRRRTPDGSRVCTPVRDALRRKHDRICRTASRIYFSLSLSCSSDDVVNFVTHPPVAFVSIYDNLQDSYIDIQVEHDGIMDRNAFRQYIVDVAKNKLLDTDIVSRPAAVVPCHESGGYGHRPSSGTRGG
jgi:hypothetical protein